VFLQYAEGMQRIKQFGAGLRALGFEPQPDPSACPDFNKAEGKNIFLIYENTCADWLTAAQVSKCKEKLQGLQSFVPPSAHPARVTYSVNAARSTCALTRCLALMVPILMMLQGCFSQSMVVSTVYATLGPEAVKDAAQEGNIYGLLCNRKLHIPHVFDTPQVFLFP
jgi:hypothetical protein